MSTEKQEPYGYFKYDLRLDAWVKSRDTNSGVAFYTHPPKHEPLTDEMIKQMKERYYDLEMRGAFADGWINAESAHGIKEKA